MHEQLRSREFRGNGRDNVDIILVKENIETRIRRQKGKRTSKDDKTWYYLGLFGEIGFSIAIPIAGGAFLGKYIDSIWSTYPRATLILLLVGIIVSITVLVVSFRKILEESNKDSLHT